MNHEPISLEDFELHGDPYAEQEEAEARSVAEDIANNGADS